MRNPRLVVSSGAGFAEVLLGNGDGTFHRGQAITQSSLDVPAVADLTGKGILDLVAANHDGTVSVFLGNGDGTFYFSRSYDTRDRSASSITIADLNGDGQPDLIVTDDKASRVSVFLGNGDGTFQNPVYADYAAVGGSPSGVAVGDLNGDGVPDLVVSGTAYGPTGPGVVSVLLGNGDGTFQPATLFAAGQSPTGLVLADFNGDGALDVAANTQGSLQVFLGNGDGTFLPPKRYTMDNYSLGMVAADLKQDGFPDLILTSYGGVRVFLNAEDWSGSSGSPDRNGRLLAVADLGSIATPSSHLLVQEPILQAEPSRFAAQVGTVDPLPGELPTTPVPPAALKRFLKTHRDLSLGLEGSFPLRVGEEAVAAV